MENACILCHGTGIISLKMEDGGPTEAPCVLCQTSSEIAIMGLMMSEEEERLFQKTRGHSDKAIPFYVLPEKTGETVQATLILLIHMLQKLIIFLSSTGVSDSGRLSILESINTIVFSTAKLREQLQKEWFPVPFYIANDGSIKALDPRISSNEDH